MYQFTKRVNGIAVQVELGVVNDKNSEHTANVHIFMPGAGHIRGITAYKKTRNNGTPEIVLRMPGYLKTPDAKQKTSYLALDQAVIDVIVEAIETVNERVPRYCHDSWGIWGTKSKVQNLDPLTPDESDKWKDPEEGAR